MKLFLFLSTADAFTDFFNHMIHGTIGDVFDGNNQFSSMFNIFDPFRSQPTEPAGALCLNNDNEMFTLDECNEVGGWTFRSYCDLNCGYDTTMCIGSQTDMKTVSGCSHNMCYSKIPVLHPSKSCDDITPECLEIYRSGCREAEEENLCGSDGETYSSQCEISRKNCDSDEEITISDTACRSRVDDHMEKFNSFFSSITQSFSSLFDSENGGVDHVKNCDTIMCPMMHDPVCASNGETYGNECMLGAETCRNPKVVKVSDGECLADTCPDVCPEVLEPVCGTDNEFYGNVCMLRTEACTNKGKQWLEVKNKGACDAPESGDESGSPDVLEIQDNKIVIVTRRSCGSCAKTYGPVCGSDGTSYLSERCFNVAKCEQDDKFLTIAKRGWCNKEDEDNYWGEYMGEYTGQTITSVTEQRPILEQRPTFDHSSFFEQRPMIEQRPIEQRPIIEQRPVIEQRPTFHNSFFEQRPITSFPGGDVIGSMIVSSNSVGNSRTMSNIVIKENSEKSDIVGGEQELHDNVRRDPKN